MKPYLTTLSIIASTMSILSGCKGGTTEELTLYAGTYGQAIHVLSYNPESGAISPKTVIPAVNASYVALGGTNAAGENVLYAVSETGDTSGVYSFAEGENGWHRTSVTMSSESSDIPEPHLRR